MFNILSFTDCLKICINIYYIMLRIVSKLIIECSAEIMSWFGEIGARFGRFVEFVSTKIMARRRKIMAQW